MIRFLSVIIALGATGLINAGFHAMDPGVQSQPQAGSHLREIISQWYWIKGYGSWMKKDERSLMHHYRLAVALDPNNLANWRLAAQTLAYDCAAWKIESLSAIGPEERGIRAEYGRKALQFYETSRPWFEDDPDWWLGAGFLAETTLQDRALALSYFRTALDRSNQTFLGGRIIVRLLIEENNHQEAYDFLKEWYPHLPEDRPEARKPTVLQWIRTLEDHLEIQDPQRLPSGSGLDF